MGYENFFKFKESPFRLTPDPDYYFPSDVHKEALDTLVYSIRSGEGFVQITGDPGTGKTLLIRTLLRQLKDNVALALILNPSLTPLELIRVIIDDLGGLSSIDTEKQSKEKLIRLFQNALLKKARQGIRTIIIVDEAQNLPNETLEELRLLSNLETDKEKLLQIILIGQVELEEKIESNSLRQLAQRITIRYKLEPLSPKDTASYIKHRLEVAAGDDLVSFAPSILKKIYKFSRGVPRRINIVCERALMAAFVDGKRIIQKNHIKKAIKSIEGKEKQREFSATTVGVLITVILILIGVLAGKIFHQPPDSVQPELTTIAQQSEKPVKQVRPETHPEKPLESISVNNPVASPAVELQEQESTIPPTEAFCVPTNDIFLSIDSAGGVATIWKKEKTGLKLAQKFEIEWPLTAGLFVLGRHKQKGEFIFSPMAASWGTHSQTASILWERVSRWKSAGAVPIIAFSDLKKTGNGIQAGGLAIVESINSWSMAWRSKNLEKLIGFYDDIYYSYELGNPRPRIYNRDQIKEKKSVIFNKSGKITLDIRTPSCFLDPHDQRTAMAVFRQDYRSNIFSDTGIKVLYFRLIDNKESEPTWKIVAKFWIPR